MEAVGIGDLHFDNQLNKHIPNLNQVIVGEVRKPLDYAIRNGIKNVFFYGDLVHTPNISADFLINFLDILCHRKYRELDFHVIVGNHDYKEVDLHSMRVFSKLVELKKINNLHIYTEPKVVEVDGVQVNFLPYPHFKTRSDCLNVAHVDVNGFKTDTGRDITDGHKAKKNHVCVIGHEHTSQSRRHIHYSGTLYQTNFGESLPKFFHHIRFKSYEKYSVELIPNDPQYKLHNVVINAVDDLDTIPKGSKNLCKLFVKDGIELDPNFLVDHDNVVKTNSFKTKKELETLITEAWEIEDGEEFAFSYRDGLKEVILSDKDSAKPVKVRALKIFDSLLKESA